MWREASVCAGVYSCSVAVIMRSVLHLAVKRIVFYFVNYLALEVEIDIRHPARPDAHPRSKRQISDNANAG